MRLKRTVFSSDLKVFNDLHVFMSSGREFHSVGAIYDNIMFTRLLLQGLPQCGHHRADDEESQANEIQCSEEEKASW